MNFRKNKITNGALVQVVTNYAIERIGRVEVNDEECLTLLPHDNEELRKIIADPKNGPIDKDYDPSVRWPVVLMRENIKEIIILKYGEDQQTRASAQSKEATTISSFTDKTYFV